MIGSVRRCHNVFLMISFEHKMSLKIEHVGAIRRWYVSDVLLGLVCWFRSLVALISIRSVCKFGMLVLSMVASVDEFQLFQCVPFVCLE